MIEDYAQAHTSDPGRQALEPDNADTRAIAELNSTISEDDRVTNVLLTVRDDQMPVWKRAV